MSDLTTGAIIAAGIAAVGGVFTTLLSRKPKNEKADYASKLLEATVPAYETLAGRLAHVEAQNEDCQQRNDDLERKTNSLERKCDRMVTYFRSVGLEIPHEIHPGD